MLVKLYDRGPEGTVKDIYYDQKHIDHLNETIFLNSKYKAFPCDNDPDTILTYRAFRYCAHCDTDFYGQWQYYHRLLSECLPAEKLAIHFGIEYGMEYAQNDYFSYEVFKSKFFIIDDNISIKRYQKFLEYQKDISPLINEYHSEITGFLNMHTCPLCGMALSTNNYDNFIPMGDSWDYELCPIEKDDNIPGANYYFFPLSTTEHIISCFAEYVLTKAELISAKKAQKGEKVIINKRWGIHNGNGYIEFFDTTDDNSILQFFISKRIIEREQSAKKRYEAFINICNDLRFNNSTANASIHIQNLESLKSFINTAKEIEASIFSVSERLKTLYRHHADSLISATGSIKKAVFKDKIIINDLKEKQLSTLNNHPEDTISLSDFPIDYPDKPFTPQKAAYPSKPMMPTLKNPNIFNKKKVLLENEELTRKYNEACTEYKAKCDEIDVAFAAETDKYNLEMREFDLLVADLERKRQKKYERAIEEATAKHSAELERINQELQEAEQKYTALVNSSDAIATPEKAANALIEDEIAKAEELLKNLFAVRNEMYASGVVFEKYCNFVALSSISEYLMSGRCTTLEGHEGAYNIYESEIRLNTVVSQLSQVIESLEQIQKNQYMIYTAINETNKQLSALNDSMDKAVSSLNDIKSDVSDMKEYMSEIAENTAVSAYYSKVNAYYSKRNAELTDALGFMAAYR